MQLNTSIKPIRVNSSVAAGTTQVNSATLDTTGFRGARFIVLFGAIAAGALTSVKLQDGTKADGTDMTDVAASHVTVPDSSSNEAVVVEVTKPLRQFVRCVVVRGTQNAAIDGILVDLHGARVLPVNATDTSIVAEESLVSPADGTA